MKFSKAIEGFLLSLSADSYSPYTVRNYKVFLMRMCRHWEDPEIDTITADLIRSYLNYLRGQGRTESTLQVYWKSIRGFFAWSQITLLTLNPAASIQSPDHTNKVVTPFTHQELQALLKACKTKREKAMVLLLLDTGLRAGEANRLLVRDISIDTGSVTVRPFGSGKKSRPRQVWMGSLCKKAMWVWLASRIDGTDPSAPIFSTRAGGRLGPFEFGRIISMIATRAGVQGAHPHKFRHTFAIEYLRNGGDVFTLQRLLGHSSLEIVKIYLDLADSDTEAAHKRASPADRLKL